jgi:hypothetical protein
VKTDGYGITVSKLEMFVVYENPRDFPGKFVVRRWEISGGGTSSVQVACRHACVCDTLEEAREPFPDFLVCLTRHPDDDPCIVEVWL